MTTILIDCDGVASDFVTPALAVVARLGGPSLLHDQLEAYDIGELLPEDKRAELWRLVSEPGFCASLLPYVGAAHAIEELRKLGTVVCVTSPMEDSATWAHERLQWLARYFGFDREHVISTAGKQWVAGDVFIDDAPKHVNAWAEAHPNGRAVLLERPWNRGATISCRATRVPSLAHAVDVAVERRTAPRGRAAG